MKVRELLAQLGRVNPEADVLIAATEREEDLLPITGLEMKIPPGELPAGKTEAEAAVQIAIKITAAAPRAEVVENIQRMQEQLDTLLKDLERALGKTPDVNGQ